MVMEEIMLPGFRFHPTDEELVGFYLKKKVQQRPISVEVIIPLDIYKHDPWDLPKLATTGEKEWYFYCRRDQKYRNSARPNRVTGSGFWKATGTDRPIYSSDGSRCIGLKKSLVFYKGRAAKGFKTDWMMHEFRLPSAADHNGRAKRLIEKTIPPNELWAICRIFKKASSSAQTALSHSWVTPILETSSSPIIPHYDKDFCHFDHKPFNIDQSTPIVTNNNKTPPSSISSNQDTNHLISVHEPDLSTAIEASSLLFNLQPSILEDFGDEGLDYMTNGDQQYFHDSCSPIASIPSFLQEKLGYSDQHQLSIDLMFQSPTDCVYFENQWDFSNTNNCFL